MVRLQTQSGANSHSTLERQRDLTIRVVSVGDLMKPQARHAHGLRNTGFDQPFFKDKPTPFDKKVHSR